MRTTKNNFCLNCGNTFADAASFCHKCGQSEKSSNLSFLDIISNFFGSLFNLDGTVIQTLKYFWHPAKLTREYIAGRRKRYLNPARLFFINLVILFAAVSYVSDTDIGFMKNIYEDYFRSKFMLEYDQASNDFCKTDQETLVVDSTRARLFKDVEHPDYDTLSSDFSFQLLTDYKPTILKKDLIELSIDSINTKYRVDGFMQKQSMRQFVKANKNMEGSIKFVLTKVFWGFIPSAMVFALVLFLVYYRSRIPYLEHLVLAFNTHSILLFILSLYLVLQHFSETIDKYGDEYDTIIMSLISLYVLWITFNYYQQGPIKTILKYIFLVISYFFIAFIFALITAIIIALLF